MSRLISIERSSRTKFKKGSDFDESNIPQISGHLAGACLRTARSLMLPFHHHQLLIPKVLMDRSPLTREDSTHPFASQMLFGHLGSLLISLSACHIPRQASYSKDFAPMRALD
ncbi:hypothetical protein IV203_025224 [Nitzschia inconspicua]|uniref:Uncharacterized protein n=1 Tax=Nitzschia inconspicua TaxID=303405 RepID=A0A9K3LIB6_9STRA|nr:hypothetical protein IV203_024766 [Nitzschia inconspicua]KAG7345851.1 hypothetical protein IV203_004918 [Nitzschia inconspicua]KAG7362340.1 hypothetical protein IV203_025224 [Nitzschia inconspicua]